ncbi:uncharacterized protein LOC144906991 [Branchiostoma floridae x Branchiostoma belcheri]
MSEKKTQKEVAKERLEKDLARYIYVPQWHLGAPKSAPTNGKVPDIPDFTPQLGDVLSWSDYRDTHTYIVGKDGALIPNPDYSGSGYLTIPLEITQHMTDARRRYEGVDVLFMDLRHDDQFIQENFGDLPEEWKFTWYDGEEELQITFPNGKMQTFLPGEHTKEDIFRWYEGSQKMQSSFSVTYDLKGEDLKRFQEKYQNKDDPNDQYAWLRARPKIPPTWTMEPGGGGGGSDRHHGTFYLNGPAEEAKAAVDAVKEFYDGFQHTTTEPVEYSDEEDEDDDDDEEEDEEEDDDDDDDDEEENERRRKRMKFDFEEGGEAGDDDDDEDDEAEEEEEEGGDEEEQEGV